MVGRHCHRRYREAIKALFCPLVDRENVQVDSKDKYGWTPLLWAVDGGHEALVRLLKS